jgi:hypothetical protein
MPSYRVSEADFYKAFLPAKLPYVPRVEASVAQIASRYGIKGKSVLSLGGGTGTEEHYFWKHGNQLTIVDIDEHGQIEPVLKTLAGGNLHYIVEDANKVEFSEKFDVLFLSSFTPDELRRSAIIQQRDGEMFERMLELNGGIWEWPWWENPFHPLVLRFARNLRDGGTMIVQSYCGGLDAGDHGYYLWACDRQLAEIGMRLLEVYRFASTTGTMLYVAAKGSPSWPLFPPITMFHGRAQPERVQCLRLVGPPGESPADKQARPPGVTNRFAWLGRASSRS